MPSEQNSANSHGENECELYDVLGYNFDFEEAEPQSNLAPPTINMRFIEPEDVAPARAASKQLIRFQAKPGATAKEIHEALQATLAANQPAKSARGPRNVTGTPEGGDRQIIGAPPPDETPPA